MPTHASDAEPGMVYRWQILPNAHGTPATLLDATSANPTVLFTDDGSYPVLLRVSRPNDQASSKTIRSTLSVDQQRTTLYVSAVDEVPEDPDDLIVPSTLPAVADPEVVGSESQDFVVTMYDQFGHIMHGTDQSAAHPSVDWKLLDATGQQLGETETGWTTGYSVDDVIGVGNSEQNAIIKLAATFHGVDDPDISGAITINFTKLASPDFSVTIDSADDADSTRQLHVTDMAYGNNTTDLDRLEYYWSATRVGTDGDAGVGFSDNGTPAAKDVVAHFSRAGEYILTVRVRDPRYFLETTYPVPTHVTLESHAKSLRVTPSRPFVGAGGHVILTAMQVDQFGQPTAGQPASVTWSLTGDSGFLVEPSVDDGDADGSPLPAGTQAKFVLPDDYEEETNSLVGTVGAELDSEDPEIDPVSIPVHFGRAMPLEVMLSVDTTADTLLGDGGPGSGNGGSHNFTGANNLVDRAQPIRAIIQDPNAGTVSWTLTATLEGSNEGTILLTGSGTAGSLPGTYGPIGRLLPTQLPDGLYTLTLRAVSEAGGISTAPATATQVVRIRSAVKLGNMALPVTDLTQNVPGGQSITVSRGYDSQRAGEDSKLGYGWTLDTLKSAVDSTMKVQYEGQGKSLAWNDIVYINLPSGEQHAFAFRPIPEIDLSQPGAGLVMTVATYTPSFQPVDGSNATLVPSDDDGDPVVTEGDLVWDSANGYMFKSTENGQGYNPALEDFGGNYLLTTEDGMKYIVDAATGRLTSQIDLLGRVQSFAGSTTSASVGDHEITYDTTTQSEGNPLDVDHPQHIVRISTRMKVGDDDAQTLQSVYYGYDAANNLIGAVVQGGDDESARQVTTYTYADQLQVRYTPDDASEAEVAAIIRNGAGQVWNGTSFVSSGGSGSLWNMDAVAIADHDVVGDRTVMWYTAEIPNGLPAGTYAIEYRDGSDVLWTETRQYVGRQQAHLMIGAVDGRGVKILSATYDPKTNQLRGLANTRGTSAKTDNGLSGTDANQGVTDPNGNSTSNQYDDHGNVIRSIQEVKDNTGKVIHYVVTVSDYLYGDNSSLDDNDRPFANVLGHSYTSSPFIVPASKASDRNLNIDQLKSKGYLKTASNGAILWASMSEYDPETRHLTDTRTLQGGNQYLHSDYDTVFDHGRPASVQAKLEDETFGAGADQGTTTNTYNDVPSSPSYGLLMSSEDATGRVTHYIYAGDPIPGSGEGGGGIGEGGGGENTAPGPIGSLYAIYRDVDGDNHPIFLTVNTYYDETTATASEPGEVFGMLYTSTDANGIVTAYKYMPDGRTAEVKRDAENESTATTSSTEYDGLGRVTSSTDEYGNVTTSTYDNNGKVIESTDAYGGVTQNTYDALGQLIRTVYPDGTETRTVYDSQGRAIWQTDQFDPEGDPANGTRTIYDRHGRAVVSERWSGVEIDIEADGGAGSDGFLVSTLDQAALDSGGDKLSETRTAYDKLGRVVQTTDAAGTRTGTIYDDQGQARFSGVLKSTALDTGTSPWWTATVPTESTSLAAFLSGLFVSVTGSISHDNFTSYGNSDHVGPPSGSHLISSKVTANYVTDGLGNTTTTYQDKFGREVQTVYADGSSVSTVYSPNNDATGQPELMGTPNFWDNTRDGPIIPSSTDGWAWFNGSNPTLPVGYTAVVQVGQRTGAAGSTEDRALGTFYVYDDKGQLTDVWLPRVADAKHGDALTRPHWHYEYDDKGNQTLEVDPTQSSAFAEWVGDNHDPLDFTGATLFEYDGFGHRTARTLPKVGLNRVTEQWEYDKLGRLQTHTDFKGQVTAYAYDNSPEHGGRLLAEYRYEFGAVAPTYTDSTGTEIDDLGEPSEKTEYTYDGLGRQTEAGDFKWSSGTSAWVESTRTITTFDPATGQVIASETTVGEDSLGVVHYEYDVAGRKVRTYTAYNDASYTYDDQGRLATVHTTKLNSATVDQTVAYTYDGAGNLATVTQPSGLTTTYTYDDLNRLTDEVVTDGDDDVVLSFAYTLDHQGLRTEVLEHQMNVDNTTFSDVKVS